MLKIRNENQKQVKKIEREGGVESARVRKENEKVCGYGREKKEDERVGDDLILKLIWEF